MGATRRRGASWNLLSDQGSPSFAGTGNESTLDLWAFRRGSQLLYFTVVMYVQLAVWAPCRICNPHTVSPKRIILRKGGPFQELVFSYFQNRKLISKLGSRSTSICSSFGMPCQKQRQASKSRRNIKQMSFIYPHPPRHPSLKKKKRGRT